MVWVAQDMVAQIAPVFVAADPQHDHPGHDEQNDGQHGEQQAAEILARDIHGSRPGSTIHTDGQITNKACE